MERVKKNQENISSASGFIHFGLSQRMCHLLFTYNPVFFFSCENKDLFPRNIWDFCNKYMCCSRWFPEAATVYIYIFLQSFIDTSRYDQQWYLKFSFKRYYVHLNRDLCF